jgi:hypothetical protein
MLAQSLRRFKKRDCALVWLEENRGETGAEQFPVFGLLFRSNATSQILLQRKAGNFPVAVARVVASHD